jgi:phage terminase small subunit
MDRGKINPVDGQLQPQGEVKKPSFVKGKAVAIWKKYAPELVAKNVLTVWDVDMFGTWCCLMAEYQKSPELFTSAKLTQMRLYAESFGLTPTGRARLRLKDSMPTADPAEQYFAEPGKPRLVSKKNA